MFKKLDPVTVGGVILALVVMVGGQWWVMSQRAKQLAEYKAAHPEYSEQQAVAQNPGAQPSPPAPAPVAGAQAPAPANAEAPAPAPSATGDTEPAAVPDVTIAATNLKIELSSAGAT